MNVKEAIEKLQKLPPDAPFLACYDGMPTHVLDIRISHEVPWWLAEKGITETAEVVFLDRYL